MRTSRVIVFAACVFLVGTFSLAASETTAVWSDGHTSAISDEQLIGNTSAAPGAAYPEEAQRTNTTGSGVYELRIDKAGKISAVAVVKSSGSAVLDKAALTAFKKWRFKPGVFRSVRIPVNWSVNRVR
ncbi:MAG TPA: energy transducer TonB [Chthoniobacterales bacterium]|nr:energy transducer TonB [Chthoniobacterales bacterium]